VSDFKTYLNDEIGPLPFCKGCGHSNLVKALDQALVKMQVDPKKTVIVTDIGCIGLCDRYFTTSAFHGLHGRSITYACGLKMANPELTVITLMGDGGCGIGGTHLLNVARRNIGITLIVGNNFNYGMTGGQHSVTTPTDGVTSTTPWGNVEGPMDLCATVSAAGASWVHRSTMFDKNLSDVMVEAIRQPGFAMMDVWELCTAYYSSRNEMGKKGLLDMLAGYDFHTGLLTDKPRPEFNARYRESFEAHGKRSKDKPPIEAGWTSPITEQKGILIAGSAGQKIKSAATVFAEGAIFSGLNATQKDDYPITVQTGHSVAEILLNPEPIEYTGIPSPTCFVAISYDGVLRTRARIANLPETCTLYAEETLDLPETRAKVKLLPFNKVGKKVGRFSVITTALAAVIEDTGLYPIEAFAAAIRRAQKPAIAEMNLKAVEAGVELMK
jgi:2-oxoglutarate/2-oxoacid ferredoxin oxidoreductase subunit beta